MKSSVYEGNKRALVATILLVVLLFVASYAYFSSFNTANLTYNLAVGEMANVTLAFTDGEEMTLIVDPLELTDQTNESVSSNTSTSVITLNNSSEYENVSCKYEIWYDPITPFKKSSSNTSGVMEYGLNISDGSVTKNIDLTDENKPLKIYDAQINDANTSGNSSVTWTFSTTFYSRFNLNQSEHIGKSYIGRVYFKSAGCEEAESIVENTLSDVVLAQVSNKEYTSSQDQSKYVVRHEEVTHEGTTYDAGVRYEGNDPDNYVQFNGNEEWRIIGVFEGSTIGLESGKYYTKIIRNKSNGIYMWDDDNYENNWSIAALNNYLTNTYLPSIDGVSRGLIAENPTWHLGGASFMLENTYTSGQFYVAERGNVGGAVAPTLLNYQNSIGLMYPSDYAYAMYAGSANAICTNDIAVKNYSTLYLKCANYDWLLLATGEWTITPNSASDGAFALTQYGDISLGDVSFVGDEFAARPVLYLGADVKISSGTGTQSDPYVLK